MVVCDLHYIVVEVSKTEVHVDYYRIASLCFTFGSTFGKVADMDLCEYYFTHSYSSAIGSESLQVSEPHNCYCYFIAGLNFGQIVVAGLIQPRYNFHCFDLYDSLISLLVCLSSFHLLSGQHFQFTE